MPFRTDFAADPITVPFIQLLNYALKQLWRRRLGSSVSYLNLQPPNLSLTGGRKKHRRTTSVLCSVLYRSHSTIPTPTSSRDHREDHREDVGVDVGVVEYGFIVVLNVYSDILQRYIYKLVEENTIILHILHYNANSSVVKKRSYL